MLESKSNGSAGRLGTYYVGNQTVQYRRDNMNIIRPVVNSLGMWCALCVKCMCVCEYDGVCSFYIMF